MQAYKAFRNNSYPVTARYKFLICAVWTSAFFFGCMISKLCSVTTVSLMRSLLYQRPSIVSLLAVIILPFLISFCVFQAQKPYLIMPLIFAKAAMFGFTTASVAFAFGSAGWMLRWLLLFSDSLANAVLLCLWLKHATSKDSAYITDLCIYIAIVICFVCFDVYIIGPYLLTLIY